MLLHPTVTFVNDLVRTKYINDNQHHPLVYDNSRNFDPFYQSHCLYFLFQCGQAAALYSVTYNIDLKNYVSIAGVFYILFIVMTH